MYKQIGKVCCAMSAVVALGILSSAVRAEPPDGFNWTLTFEDQFEGTELDTTKWRPRDHMCGTRNNELQGYVPENVSVENGVCRLKLEKRSVSYEYCGNPGNTKEYASGIIISQKKFAQRYGYFEARLKLPRGRDLWPAFWVLADDIRTIGTSGGWPPEADILELINGGDGAQYSFASAWYTSNSYPACTGGGGGNDFWTSSNSGKDITTEFVSAGMLWTPDSVVFFNDDKRFDNDKHTEHIQWECPFMMLINLAMKPNVNDAMLPAFYEIDWVRVWQYGDEVEGIVPLPETAVSSIRYTCADGVLRIEAPAGTPHTVKLIDTRGRLCLQRTMQGAWTPDMNSPGVYTIAITQGSATTSGTIVLR